MNLLRKITFIVVALICIFGSSGASAATGSSSTEMPPSGFVQTSSETAVHCSGGMMIVIVTLDQLTGIGSVAPPVGTPCTAEALAQVPGEPGIFVDPLEGFVVTNTTSPSWTGHRVHRCEGPTLVWVDAYGDGTVFEMTEPNSPSCRSNLPQ